jgi:hypothetical protein
VSSKPHGPLQHGSFTQLMMTTSWAKQNEASGLVFDSEASVVGPIVRESTPGPYKWERLPKLVLVARGSLAQIMSTVTWEPVKAPMPREQALRIVAVFNQ